MKIACVHVKTFKTMNRKSFDGYVALEEIGSYLYPYRNKFDVAYVLYDECKTALVLGQPFCGIAFIGAACYYRDKERLSYNIGLGHDNGEFSGVDAAAHEIAHLLGADHDGKASDLDGSPGAEDCPTQDHLMAVYLREREDKSKVWSSCTIKQIKYFFREYSKRRKCLHTPAQAFDTKTFSCFPAVSSNSNRKGSWDSDSDFDDNLPVALGKEVPDDVSEDINSSRTILIGMAVVAGFALTVIVFMASLKLFLK